MKDSRIAVMASRHAAFYSPLICTLAGGFLREEGFEAVYSVLQPGQRSRELLRGGTVDVMQSAVGSNWGPLEQGETGLPVHFAQINRRDGFFLASRRPFPNFSWKNIEGATLLADHGHQPLLMLRYAAAQQGVDWSKIDVVDAGGVDEMDAAFRSGRGGLIHQQGPAPQQLEHEGLAHVVASAGEAMPPVAFSSLAATREFLATEAARAFTRAYRRAREWVQNAEASEVAETEAAYFSNVSREALVNSVARYQQLGCWTDDIAIPRDLYEQALEVFLAGGAITKRHPYEQVVVPPPA